MTIRKLTSSDIFPLCTIIKKIGIEDVKGIIRSEEVMKLVNGEEKNANKIGVVVFLDLANLIISNLPKCEKEIYEFLSSVTGEKVEDIRAISPAEFLQLILDVFRSEDFKDFFTVVLGFLKSEK